jgi:transposase-like protein
MTQKENTGISSELQTVLLDEHNFLKTLVQECLQQLLKSEFDRHINAAPHERSSERRGLRNGSYYRSLKTRVGSIELNVCRDREGRFRTELFRRYQRSEQAFLLSMIEMYIQGVSTRKVSHIVETLCGMTVSKSQVSELSKSLDTQLHTWRNRQLTELYPYLVVDARYEKIRTAKGVVSRAVMIVIGISEHGHRSVLSVELGDSENETTWSDVFNKLKARGLKGVEYVVSDDHQGLVNALERHLQGVVWQRCQVHFIRNFISKMKRRRDIKTFLPLLKDIYAASSYQEALRRKQILLTQLETANRDAATWLDEELESTLSVYHLPAEHRRKMKSTNMLERLNQELKRRSRVIRIFPNEASCIRLIGTLCQETSEAWETGKRYFIFDKEQKEIIKKRLPRKRAA